MAGQGIMNNICTVSLRNGTPNMHYQRVLFFKMCAIRGENLFVDSLEVTEDLTSAGNRHGLCHLF